MTCSYCGQENQPGVRFCSRCGAQFPSTPAPQAQPPYIPADESRPDRTAGGAPGKLKSPLMKKILMIAIPVIVIVIAAIIVIPLATGGSGNAMRKDHIQLFFEGEDLIIISGNNNAKFTIDGEFYSMQRSIDGSKAALLTDFDYDNDNGGTLWFVTTSGVYHVADDVMACLLADSGNGLVYASEFDREYSAASLYLYDTSSRKAARVTDDAYFSLYNYRHGVCISPNGKSISFISDYNDEDDSFYGYMSIDGKSPERIGSNMFAVALSDGGRYLYYAKESDSGNHSLHVRSGRNDYRLVSEVSGGSMSLNMDYSQAVFNDGDRSYITRNGGEKERISGSYIRSFIFPRGTQMGGNHDFFTVYGIRSFLNNVVRNEDGLAYLSNSLDMTRISSTSQYASSAFISDNGRTLLYLNNSGHLSAIDPTKPGAERREIGRNVENFIATNDTSVIYFVNEDDELYYVKGDNAPVKVADDVYANSLRMPFYSKMAFFLVDYSPRDSSGELFYSNNGARRAKVERGNDITSLWVTPTNVFFENIDDEVYRSNGNEVFIKFAEDVTR